MEDVRTIDQHNSDNEEKHKPCVDVVIRVGDVSTGAVHVVVLISANVVVEELREELERQSGVPAPDQILLCGPPFARLDPRRALEYYGLPADDKEVYLYDRRLLSQETANSPPTVTALTPVHINLPSQPVASSEGSKTLSESSHPMMRALVEYEGYFQLQVRQSEALENGTRANISATERGTQELHVQERGIDAAVANLDLFKTSMMKHFAPFWEDFQITSEKHERLLSQFEKYLDALATVELHPALATEERKTLYDCIPIEKEREWAIQCEQSHNHVRAQVLKLQRAHDDICNEVSEMVTAHSQTNCEYEEAKTELEAMKLLGNKQMKMTITLRENLQYVLSSLEETSTIASGSNPLQASTNALDVCRRIDELYQRQQNMIPDAQKLMEQISTYMQKIAFKKISTFERVHSTLRQISIFQSKIRDFENSLAVFREALAAQKKHFYELEHLDKLPESYAACLKEISRRLKYGRKFSDRIQSMAEELAQMREDEVQHREEFLRSFGQHLPRDFVSGLAEKPSHCEFRMRPFDQTLPLIEDGDDQDFDKDHKSLDSDNSSFTDVTNNMELAERCKQLELRVSELTAKLKNKLYYDGSESDSVSRSDVSKTSAREGESSCEFPLVLAIAATAGAMNNSEADRSNMLDRELTMHENSDAGSKEVTIAKLESENQQFLLNAAAFEEEIQERSKREIQLQETQSTLQQTIQDLRSIVRSQRASLTKLSTLLQLPDPSTDEDIDTFTSANFNSIEARVKELLASAESEMMLQSELEQRLEPVQDVNDSFKISFRSFSVNDLALFLPTSAPGSDAQRVYLAFHLGCPHRFLSEESISSFSNDGQRYPDYVVGRIVLIDEQMATEGNNPYALHLGTTFYVLTVASLHES